jgi:hypothetical protein
MRGWELPSWTHATQYYTGGPQIGHTWINNMQEALKLTPVDQQCAGSSQTGLMWINNGKGAPK